MHRYSWPAMRTSMKSSMRWTPAVTMHWILKSFGVRCRSHALYSSGQSASH